MTGIYQPAAARAAAGAPVYSEDVVTAGVRDASRLTPFERRALADTLACSIVGGPERVKQGLAEFVGQTGADELIVTSMFYDHEARLRSYELLAEARDALGA